MSYVDPDSLRRASDWGVSYLLFKYQAGFALGLVVFNRSINQTTANRLLPLARWAPILENITEAVRSFKADARCIEYGVLPYTRFYNRTPHVDPVLASNISLEAYNDLFDLPGSKIVFNTK